MLQSSNKLESEAIKGSLSEQECALFNFITVYIALLILSYSLIRE